MSGADRYPQVFTPIEIGGVRLRNRIFVPAHTTNLAENFLPSERNAAYLAERAKGGAALIFTEAIRVHVTSLGRAAGLSSNDERALPGYRRMAEAVQEHGAALFAQIMHSGRHSDNIFLRTASWGPSPLPYTVGAPVPHAMTHHDIHELLAAFVYSAEMMAEAGMRGLEVQIGHGHLLHQFLSPLANVRDDEYGGSEENRLRLSLEVLRQITSAVGGKMAIGVRMSADDFQRGGIDLETSKRMMRTIQQAVPLDFINVSHSSFNAPSIGFHMADMSYGPVPFLHLPLAIHDSVPEVPVFAVCRFTSLGLAEQALETGKIAMVGMARAHIADPHLIRKTLEDREAEIIPCVACNRCHAQIEAHQPITCMMNPSSGKEREWPHQFVRAAERRKVLVIGGGPAGLEAARVAAERGHEVHLWEAAGELGGQVRIGRRGHLRKDLDKIRQFQQAQHERLGIQVRLGIPVTEADVLAFAPDAVIVATGGRPASFSVEGAEQIPPAVAGFGDATMANQRVVILDQEGGWTVASAAETFAAQGAEVIVATPQSSLLPGIANMVRITYLDRLGKAGVTFKLLRRPVAFRESRLELADTLTGAVETIDHVDRLYAVAPPVSDHSLADALADRVPRLSVIGDAEAPRTLLEAIFAGHREGRAL